MKTRALLFLTIGLAFTPALAQDAGLDSLRRALRQAAGNDELFARTAIELSQRYWANGIMDSALIVAQRGMERVGNAPSAQQHRVALSKAEGMALFASGAWPAALEAFQRMHRFAEAVGDDHGLGRALTYEGHTLREMGDNGNAIGRYREAIRVLGRGEQAVLGHAYHGLATTFTNEEEWDSAVHWFEQAMALYTRLGDVEHAVGTRFNLAENYYAQGRHDLERAQMDSIATHTELLDDPDFRMRFLGFRARSRRAGEHGKRELADLDSAIAIARMLEDTHSIGSLSFVRALALAHADRWPEAYRDLEAGKQAIWWDMGIAKVRATEAARQQLEREKDEALAAAELRKEQIGKWSAIVIGALAMLLAFVWYRSFRAKSRVAEELRRKNAEIERAQSALIVSEKQREAEQVRTRIARDIHDEIGATLTKIALLSGVAVQKDGGPEEQKKTFARISEHTQNVSRALSDVVWAVDPQRDTHQGMLDHVRDLSQRLLGDNGIRYELDLSAVRPDASIAPALKRDLHLLLNECCNNILKYARARFVRIAFHLNEGSFALRVEDDGVGFDMNGIPERGNGLRNMPQRVSQHGGQLVITSAPGMGTVLDAHGPLA